MANVEPTRDGDKLVYRAWAICRRDTLAAAEVTMDPDKAAVWKRGGHVVVDLLGTLPMLSGETVPPMERSS